MNSVLVTDFEEFMLLLAAWKVPNISKKFARTSSAVLRPIITSGCLVGSNLSLTSSISSVPLPFASNLSKASQTILILCCGNWPQTASIISLKSISPLPSLSKREKMRLASLILTPGILKSLMIPSNSFKEMVPEPSVSARANCLLRLIRDLQPFLASASLKRYISILLCAELVNSLWASGNFY
jgi:hypothetical protein